MAFVNSLAKGEYNVSAAAPGYASASQQVTLKSGPTLTVEIRLESVAGSLEGQVTDDTSGSALAGATVSLAQWSSMTDDTGHYRLERVPPGEYTLQVSIGGYQTHQLPATIEARGSHTLDVALSPMPGLIRVRVVDAATGLPIEGATVSYGSVAEASVDAEALCGDNALLVPLKRSRQYRAVRSRVSDPRPSDSWQSEGLHFFVFTLARGESDLPSPAEPPVAVFVMRPGEDEPVSAVVVRPRSDGLDSETIRIIELESASDPVGSD